MYIIANCLGLCRLFNFFVRCTWKENYMKKAFTLIELLVVVLIIGILSAIALPQYTKTVERARVAEVLSNVKTIEESIDIYLLENGRYPSANVWFKDMGTAAELSGGTWNGSSYYTKYFEYGPFCDTQKCGSEIYRQPNGEYAFWIVKGTYSGTTYDTWHQVCITESSDIGRYICKSLESLGWEYEDGDM